MNAQKRGIEAMMVVDHGVRLSIVSLMLLFTTQLFAADMVISAVELLGSGIFEAQLTGQREVRTPGAVPAEIVKRANFLALTTEIPARIGTNFGFRYLINTSPKGSAMDIRAVIIFPGEGLVTPAGRTYKQSTENLRVKVGESTLYGYGFDEPWELITGPWVFQIWYRNSKLLEQTFNVIEDPQAD